MARRSKKFIKQAIGKGKKGALRRQLGIPKDKKIPKTLLKKIVATEAGDTIKNPTQIGNKTVKVTRLVEQRSNLALTLKKL